MEQISQNISELQRTVEEAFSKLSIADKSEELTSLQERLAAPDFWQTTDQTEAQTVSKQQASLEAFLSPWLALAAEIQEINEFVELGDSDMEAELAKRLEAAKKKYESLKSDLRFSGSHDSENVVMTIQAGAGGTDAQDWAQMLQRMYVKWAEKHEVSVTTLSESAGDEAGIKSVSMLMSGSFVYGKLKGEHGVHRLVRLSPFNSANSRETSFAMVEIVPELSAPDAVELDETELRVDVYRAGGHGGQSVNTTDSAVRITHEPTGIVVSIQNERSQLQNKETAMKVLKSRLMQLAEEQHKEQVSDLKGPNQEAAWGNQIRSYVLHPYTMVKDSRSAYQSSDVQGVLDGDISPLIDAYLDATMGE